MLFPVDIHFLSVVSKDVSVSRSGIDIGLPEKTPVIACDTAVVVYAGPAKDWGQAHNDSPDAGLLVILRLDKPVIIDERAYEIACYGNLSSIELAAEGETSGLKIQAGERVGRSGAGGGIPHLNFSLLSIDDGGLERPLDRERLEEFIWTEIANVAHTVRSPQMR